jgi:hypothetical protein
LQEIGVLARYKHIVAQACEFPFAAAGRRDDLDYNFLPQRILRQKSYAECAVAAAGKDLTSGKIIPDFRYQ